MECYVRYMKLELIKNSYQKLTKTELQNFQIMHQLEETLLNF